MDCKPTALLLLTRFLLEIFKIQGTKLPNFSSLIVFGDSTVDSGNNKFLSTLVRSDFEPYGRDFAGGKPTGRFSNGKLPTDFISEALGLKPTVPAYLDPTHNVTDFATGVCFASAGTGYDNATADIIAVLPLWKQLEYYKEYQNKLRSYLGKEKANKNIKDSLYAISIGTNDFITNYFVLPHRSLEFSVEQYQDFLLGIARDFLTNLYRLGARKIAIAGLPPMGCLPLERSLNILSGHGCLDEFNNVAKSFNVKLQNLVKVLNLELDGIMLRVWNPYDTLFKLIQNPSSFGFEKSGEACCATGLFDIIYACNKFDPLTCTDANKYVFWDTFHPTEKTNSIIAQDAVKTVLPTFVI